MRVLVLSLMVLLGALEGWAAEASAPATQPASPPASGSGRVFDASRSDPEALVLAEKVVNALGGFEKWRDLRYLTFTFRVEKEGSVVAERKHYWDRGAGRHRLEGKTQDGKPFLVLTDLARNKGSAYIGGERLSGEEAQKYLENAYALWINDTYWLTMPFKVRDPGVILTKAAPEKVGDVTYPRFHVGFDGVGLTPKDVYWIYVNPDSGRPDFWAFVLGGGSEAPTLVEWTGWKEIRGVQLSTERVVKARDQRILFPDLESPEQLPAELFERPSLTDAEEPPAPAAVRAP